MTTNDTDPELIVVLKKIRYDLTDLQVKIGEALRQAAALKLPPPTEHRCSYTPCAMTFRSLAKLQEHLYSSHLPLMPAGWLPDHYRKAEQLAGMTPPDETETP